MIAYAGTTCGCDDTPDPTPAPVTPSVTATCEDGDSFFLEVDVKYNGESVSGCYEDSAGTRNSITRYSMDGELSLIHI